MAREIIKTEDIVGKVEGLLYRGGKPDGKQFRFTSEEVKICEQFFEKEALVTFAREEEFKGETYGVVFIQGVNNLRKHLQLQFEPRETLVVFLRRRSEPLDRFLILLTESHRLENTTTVLDKLESLF
jgi:hypothetical protein